MDGAFTLLPSTQVMVFSLQATGTTKPIVIMTTPQVSPRSQTQLAKTGARVIEVEPIPNPCTDANPTAGWINSGYTKLHIWNLTQFSKRRSCYSIV